MDEIKIFENTEFGNIQTVEENGKVLFLWERCGQGFRVCKTS